MIGGRVLTVSQGALFPRLAFGHTTEPGTAFPEACSPISKSEIKLTLLGSGLRWWSIRFLAEYVEGVLLVFFFVKLADAGQFLFNIRGNGVTAQASNWVDYVNEYLFFCDQLDWRCGLRVSTGAMFYMLLFGVLLDAPVGFDAFIAHHGDTEVTEVFD